MPYTLELQNDPEQGWFVRVRQRHGCMSDGDTAEEAVTMIQEAMARRLEVALEEGLAIPTGRLAASMPGDTAADLLPVQQYVPGEQWTHTTSIVQEETGPYPVGKETGDSAHRERTQDAEQ